MNPKQDLDYRWAPPRNLDEGVQDLLDAGFGPVWLGIAVLAGICSVVFA